METKSIRINEEHIHNATIDAEDHGLTNAILLDLDVIMVLMESFDVARLSSINKKLLNKLADASTQLEIMLHSTFLHVFQETLERIYEIDSEICSNRNCMTEPMENHYEEMMAKIYYNRE